MYPVINVIFLRHAQRTTVLFLPHELPLKIIAPPQKIAPPEHQGGIVVHHLKTSDREQLENVTINNLK